jgi:hypothetical protein
MAKRKKRVSALSTAAKLSILRLAALSVDIRRKLSRAEIEQVPSLRKSFKALDAVMEELGWGHSSATTKSSQERKGVEPSRQEDSLRT